MNWIPFNPDWNESTEPRVAVAEPTRSTIPSPAKSKVIVAEDDAISREVVSSLLRNWGYEVFVTQNGIEALEALRAQTGPVLAVLDWMMPGADGIEVCRRVRQMEKLVYILLLTARSGKEQLVEAFSAGADDYLVKPFKKEELRARLTGGLRILTLQATLAARVSELEQLLEENHNLRLQIPL
jgi:DNA-binding response OmpR family regulator